MADGGFRAGQHLNWRAVNYVIERLVDGDRWQLRNLQTNETTSHDLSDLLRAYEVGDLFFQVRATVDSDPDAELQRLLERSLSSFPEAEVARAKHLERYCKAIDAQEFQSLEPISLQPFIKNQAEKFSDTNPPSSWQLYRGYRAWIQSDQDVRSLMAQHWKKGNRDSKTDEGVPEVIDASIKAALNHREKRTSMHVHDEVVVRITKLNKFREEKDQLKIPTRRTIQRKIASLPAYELALMKHGRRYADHEFRVSLAGPEATSPLERVEFDFTPADANMLIDEAIGLPMGRCTTASMVDCYSDCCIASEVFPDTPNTANALTTLSQAILPKTWVRERYPDIKYDWPCHGVPNLIVFDNPWELIGKQIEKACIDLKFDVQFAPPRMGSFKGEIERFQQTTNFTLLHPAKGTTLSNYLELIDYDPHEQALITLQDYNTQRFRWIVDVFNRTKRGKPCYIPVERWQEGMRSRGIPFPSSAASLLPVIGLHQEGIVQHYGLVFKYIRYNSQILGDIRRKLGNRLRLKFVVNPQDLGSIQVMHPRDGIYLTVPAVKPYAKGLKLYQHKALLKAAEIEARKKVDEIELAHIRHDICKTLSGEIAKSNARLNKRKLFILQAQIESSKPAETPKPVKRPNSLKRPNTSKTTPRKTENYEADWL